MCPVNLDTVFGQSVARASVPEPTAQVTLWVRLMSRCVKASRAGTHARRQNPTRFATDRDAKILDLPAAAWINELPKKEDATAA